MSSPPLFALHGGIKPPAHKSRTRNTAIRHAGIPAQLRFALAQRNANAIPCVTIGQTVGKGEVIANAGDDFGAPLHASTSGTIVAIDEHAIVLQSDGADRWCERRPLVDFAEHPAALIATIRAAGIVGAGGAGFPAARKLDVDAPIKTLIVNGAECEPYITADDRLMRERAAEIAHGVRILQHILRPVETLIGIEDENSEALTAMRAACGDSARVVALPSVYPIGGEAQLLRVLTGKTLSRGAHPADIGALCFNVGTVAAIYRAIVLGEPMLSRIVTITGGACDAPGNFEALIGTPLTHLLEQAGFVDARCATLINGGGMMGAPLPDASACVEKTSHCFIAGTLDEFPPRTAQPCIRCDYCAQVCPAALLPQQLHAYARVENVAQLQRHRLFDCIECGACDYICPSQIALTATFRSAKRRLDIIDYEDRQAPIARNRFATHQARIAREQHEREQRRQQRLLHGAPATADAEQKIEAAADTPAVDSKKAAIQAAIARAKARKTGATQRPAVVAALADDEANPDTMPARETIERALTPPSEQSD